MDDNTLLKDNEGEINMNILEFVAQKCGLSLAQAEEKYEGYKDKKKAKMHNLHQTEMIELLREMENEGYMSYEAYVKNSAFYFAKYDSKVGFQIDDFELTF